MEYICRKTKTCREEFLEIMDEIIPWDEWVGVNFMTETVPDETTLCKFRHLLKKRPDQAVF